MATRSRFLVISTISSAALLLTIPSSEAQSNTQDKRGPQGQRKNSKVDPAYKPWKWRAGSYAELHKQTNQQQLSSPPPGFPIAVYGTAKFLSGNTSTDAFGKNTTIRLQSGDNYVNVTQWYKAALKGGGWKMTESAPLPGTKFQTLSGYKLGKYCRVQVSHRNEGSEIYLSLKEKQ
jgi:uncharacterized protein (DUF2141 family)